MKKQNTNIINTNNGTLYWRSHRSRVLDLNNEPTAVEAGNARCATLDGRKWPSQWELRDLVKFGYDRKRVRSETRALLVR